MTSSTTADCSFVYALSNASQHCKEFLSESMLLSALQTGKQCWGSFSRDWGSFSHTGADRKWEDPFGSVGEEKPAGGIQHNSLRVPSRPRKICASLGHCGGKEVGRPVASPGASAFQERSIMTHHMEMEQQLGHPGRTINSQNQASGYLKPCWDPIPWTRIPCLRYLTSSPGNLEMWARAEPWCDSEKRVLPKASPVNVSNHWKLGP